MTFGPQVVTKERVASGYIMLRFGAGAGTVIGPVRSITDIATGETLYSHKGYGATGSKNTVAHFPTELGSGDVSVTVDEFSAANLAFTGEQVKISLSQLFPKHGTANRGWEWYAATAYVVMKSIKPTEDTPSTITFDIKPWAAAGTQAWALAADVTIPVSH